MQIIDAVPTPGEITEHGCISVLNENKEYLLDQLKSNDLTDAVPKVTQGATECESKIRNVGSKRLLATNECTSNLTSLAANLILQKHEDINSHQLELHHFSKKTLAAELAKCKQKLDVRLQAIGSDVELFRISGSDIGKLIDECKTTIKTDVEQVS